MAKPTRLVEDMDLTSTIVNLKKWLKTRKLGIELDVPGQDLPDGLRHGILFMEYLRTSQNFPAKLTASEESVLRVFAGLSAKVETSADGAAGGSNQATTGVRRKKNEETKENVPKGKPKTKNGDDQKVNKPGPKKGARKLAPLSEAMKNLNVQENKGCSCKGDCKTKVCGCQKKAIQCMASCKCSNKCVNKKSEKQSDHEPEVQMDAADSSSDEASDGEATGGEDDDLGESE